MASPDTTESAEPDERTLGRPPRAGANVVETARALLGRLRVPPLLSDPLRRFPWRRLIAGDSRFWIVLAALLGLGYVEWFSELSLRIFYQYGSPPYDLAIFDQGLWLISHAHVPFVTVMGRNLFGDHASFILLFLVPVYRLVPEPQGILILQAVLIASPAWPIFLLARKHLRHGAFASALVAIYLLNPVIQLENVEQFHPEAFKVALVAGAIYAAVESRWRLLLITAFLILLVKEDTAAFVVPLGIWVFARRSRRVGTILVLGGLAAAALDNLLIIPALLGGPSYYPAYLPFGGVTGLLATLWHRPGQIWSYLVVRPRLWYLYQLGAPLAFVFLWAPELALLTLPVTVENEIAGSPYLHQINYHYSMATVPILTIATIYALARISRGPRRIWVTSGVLACALWSCSVWGYAPFSANQVGPAAFPGNAVTSINDVTADLPTDASVSAWYPFVAHLDHRTHIYVWPSPVTTANWGLYNDPAAAAASAAEASRSLQYLLLPTSASLLGTSAGAFSAVARYFHVVRESGGIALYQRNGGHGVLTASASSSG